MEQHDDCRIETKSAGELTFSVGAWGTSRRVTGRVSPAPVKSFPDKVDTPSSPIKVKKGHTKKARQRR